MRATSVLMIMVMGAGPWVLVSQITRQACQGAACRPAPGQAGLQERLVHTFGTMEACLKVREHLRQQLPATENAVGDLVAAQSRDVSLRVRTIFLCLPRAAT